MAKKLGFLLPTTIFWWALVGTGLYTTLSRLADYVDARSRFVPAEGVVERSETKTSPSRRGDTHDAEIVYRYEVDGHTYRSSRFSFSGDWKETGDRSMAKEREARYPEGSSVTVFYDPENPKEAVIDLGFPGGTCATLLFLQPFVMLGVGLLTALVTAVPVHRRLRAFLSNPPVVPWRIPDWGVLESGVGGMTVSLRPRRLLWALGAYSLAAFLVAGGFIFTYSHLGDFVRAGFGIAIALPFAAAVAAAIVASKRDRSSLHFQTQERSLAFRKPDRNFEAPFDSIEVWAVRERWEERKGGRERAGYALDLHTRDGEALPIHEFSGEEAERVARKVAEYFSAITGTERSTQDTEGRMPPSGRAKREGGAEEQVAHPSGSTVKPTLGVPALVVALTSMVAGIVLLPLALAKAGRILTNAEGGIIINPVSFRGLGVLLAADISLVVGIHLWRSLVRPRASLLPISMALAIQGVCGLAMGALGLWLLLDPWRPEPDAGVDVPPGTAVDLAGFAAGAIALLAVLLFRREYARFWEETADGRSAPQRDQTIGERLRNGFFMGLIAGTVAGTIAAMVAVGIAHALGSPMTHRVYFIVGWGTPISVLVQVYMVGAGLRGQITKGRGAGIGR